MDGLKEAVYSGNPETIDDLLRIVEKVLQDRMTDIYDESMRLVDQYDETQFVHYYAGKTMAMMDISRELGINLSPEEAVSHSKAIG